MAMGKHGECRPSDGDEIKEKNFVRRFSALHKLLFLARMEKRWREQIAAGVWSCGLGTFVSNFLRDTFCHFPIIHSAYTRARARETFRTSETPVCLLPPFQNLPARYSFVDTGRASGLSGLRGHGGCPPAVDFGATKKVLVGICATHPNKRRVRRPEGKKGSRRAGYQTACRARSVTT